MPKLRFVWSIYGTLQAGQGIQILVCNLGSGRVLQGAFFIFWSSVLIFPKSCYTYCSSHISTTDKILPEKYYLWTTKWEKRSAQIDEGHIVMKMTTEGSIFSRIITVLCRINTRENCWTHQWGYFLNINENSKSSSTFSLVQSSLLYEFTEPDEELCASTVVYLNYENFSLSTAIITITGKLLNIVVGYINIIM